MGALGAHFMAHGVHKANVYYMPIHNILCDIFASACLSVYVYS